EQPAESEVLVLGQMLVAEENHQILGKRAMDLVEGAVAERLREIDPADLTADDRRQLVDRYRVVRRRHVGDMLVTRPVVRTDGIHCAFLWLPRVPYHIWAASIATLRAIRSAISSSPNPVSRRISRECCPNRGAGWRNAQSASLNRTGGLTIRMLPSVGCSAGGNISTAARCSSDGSCASGLTGPDGMSADLSLPSQNAVGASRTHSAISA